MKPYYFKCPSCGKRDSFSKPRDGDSSLGCALLIFGGILPALLYADHKSHQVQCGHCARIFRQPQLRSSGLQKCATWVTVFIIIPLIVGVMLAVTDSGAILPAIGNLEWLEALIASSPRVVMYYLILVLPLILLTVGIAAFLGAREAKESLRQNYRLGPPKNSPSDSGAGQKN